MGDLGSRAWGWCPAEEKQCQKEMEATEPRRVRGWEVMKLCRPRLTFTCEISLFL